VSYRVAAHAHCPVAVVPERRMPRRDHRAPRVVVGISPTTSGRFALEFAFDEAKRRGATLVAVQASAAPESAERLELAATARRYRSVPLEPLVVDAEPSDALLQAAQDAQLVVVGCHHSEDRWSTRLGPVPSTIMHRSPCPVIVVGELHPASATDRGGVLAADFA
jgi:nucleotide-binding universal stress UspA family protein